MSEVATEAILLSVVSFIIWLFFGWWYWKREKTNDALTTELRNRISRLEDIVDDNCQILEKRIEKIEREKNQ